MRYLLILLVLAGCTVKEKTDFPTLFKVEAPIQQTIPGYDALGLAMYCGRYLDAPHLPALSTLENTFGDPKPCIEKKMNKQCLDLIQIDLIDATCHRNNKCPPGVPKPTDLKVIKKRAAGVQNLADKLQAKCPETQWQVSPALEHDEKNPNTVKKMMAAAKEGCPKCNVVNSPFSGAKLEPLELHGTKVKAYSVSGDGASIFDGDTLDSDKNNFNHTRSGKFSTYAWWNELNLRCTGEKNFTPPLKRTEKPTSDQFWQAFLTMGPEESKPTPPSQCKVVREIKAPEIGKPNAESYCNGQQKDSRGNKPLIIIKKTGKRGDKLKVFNKDGKEVGCFQYYGPFTTPGLHRWYMGDCSKQTPYKLYKDLKSEWGYVRLKPNECLLINSIRRLGTYR